MARKKCKKASPQSARIDAQVLRTYIRHKGANLTLFEIEPCSCPFYVR